MTQLELKYFPNALGDQSLFVPAGSNVDHIPEDYKRVLRESHFRFISDPSTEIKSQLPKISFTPLRDWLEHVSGASTFGVIIHYADVLGNGAAQYDLTVCAIQARQSRFWRLPTEAGPSSRRHLPTPLDQLYSVTDGIVESADAFQAAGFVASQELFFDFASSYPIRNPAISNPRSALTFFRSGAGDYIIADKARAYLFSHEDCSFRDCGPLDDVITSYFVSRIQNKNWNPFQAI